MSYEPGSIMRALRRKARGENGRDDGTVRDRRIWGVRVGIRQAKDARVI
jgi:hypothetical protein